MSGVVAQSTPAGRLASGKGGLGIRLTDKNHQGDHALGGAAAGAVAGTALAAASADTVIRIPASHTVIFSLTAPEQVTVR